jgi:hypothetical protein
MLQACVFAAANKRLGCAKPSQLASDVALLVPFALVLRAVCGVWRSASSFTVLMAVHSTRNNG